MGGGWYQHQHLLLNRGQNSSVDVAQPYPCPAPSQLTKGKFSIIAFVFSHDTSHAWEEFVIEYIRQCPTKDR